MFRLAGGSECHPSQTADFVCAVELSAIVYSACEQMATDEKVFGSGSAFKRNYLNKARKRTR